MAKIFKLLPSLTYKLIFFAVFAFLLLSPLTIINLRPTPSIVKADTSGSDFVPEGTGYGTVSRQTAVDNGTINTPADQTPVVPASQCGKYADDKDGRLASACLLTETEPDSIGNGELSFLRTIVLGIPRLLLEGTYTIAAYSNFLLTYIIINIVGKPITTDPTFASSWQLVRDLANMVIVLGFVIVGIATALRIREYEAKQLLGKLIMIALVVNFSGLFCGVLIDASNMITNNLGGQSSAGTAAGTSSASTTTNNLTPGSTMLTAMSNSSRKSLDAATANTNIWIFGERCFLFSIVFLGTAFTLLYLTAIFVARYAILIFLFILSPLAFAFFIYPATKKMWTEWWDNFLKWSFVGVFGSFVLYVASSLVTAIGGTDQLSILSSCAVVLIFLYAGFKITAQKTGVASMAGGAIMGMAKGVTGFAVGAIAGGAAGGGKMLDKLTGGHVSSGIQRLSTGTQRMQERLGLKARDEKSFSSMSTEKLAQVAGGNEIGSTAKDRAQATQEAVKRGAGAISAIGGHDAQAKAVNDAQAYFKTRGIHSDIKSDALKMNVGLGSPTEAREAAAKQTPQEFAKNQKVWDAATLEAMPREHIEHMISGQKVPKASRDAFKNLLTTTAGQNQLADHAMAFDVKTPEGRKRFDDFYNKIDETNALLSPSQPASLPQPPPVAPPASRNPNMKLKGP